MVKDNKKLMNIIIKVLINMDINKMVHLLIINVFIRVHFKMIYFQGKDNY